MTSSSSSSSKKWAKTTSRFASQIYFLIIFQIPLFRFPCGTGIFTTPIEFTLSQLIASEILPAGVLNFLLYPGELAKAIFKNRTIPSYNNLLKHRQFSNMRIISQTIAFKHIEVLAGSYFCVAGSFLGLITPGRMSLLGILLIIWGIIKEIVFGKHTAKNQHKVVCIYWTMSIAVLSAFLSVRGDVRKLIRSCKVKCFSNPLKNYSKTKYK